MKKTSPFSNRPLIVVVAAVFAITLFIYSSGIGYWKKMHIELSGVGLQHEKSIFLPDEPLTPYGLAATKDGALIVAGAARGSKEAWVARVNPDGKLAWKHDVTVPDGQTMGQKAHFADVAVLSNGSILACGKNYMDRVRVGGLITRLDGAGNVLEERVLSPSDPLFSNGSFIRCSAWNDGVLVVGAWSHVTQKKAVRVGELSIETKGYYWIIALDKDGRLLWESLVENAMPGLPDLPNRMHLFKRQNGGFITVAHASARGTEIVAYDKTGAVLSRQHHKRDNLVPAEPLADSGPITLFSNIAAEGNVLRLGRDLAVETKRQGSYLAGLHKQIFQVSEDVFLAIGSRDIFPRENAARVMLLSSQNNDSEQIQLGTKESTGEVAAGLRLGEKFFVAYQLNDFSEQPIRSGFVIDNFKITNK